MSDTPRTDGLCEADGAVLLRCVMPLRDLARQLERELAAARAETVALRDALTDALHGWRYIRETYGNLYGVGWDRVERRAIAALAREQEQPR